MSIAGQREVEIAPGVQLPMVGLGTWSLDDPYATVRTALDLGYRHVDTAFQYRNESEVGRAIRDSGVPRECVFVTTKITSSQIGREDATISSSLRDLNTDYVDLWLIHDPPPPGRSERLWEYMIGLRDAGRARAIGVSEYGTRQVDEIVAATGVTPAVNQIRWAPTLFSRIRLTESRARGIQLEGFSALRLTDLTTNAISVAAAAHGVSPAQVLLRWHIDHGVVTIPRSSTPARIAQNLDVWDFELTAAERDSLDELSVVGRSAASPARASALDSTAPVGSIGRIVAPTGVPTGAGEIEIPGFPAHLAWSLEPVAVGAIARVVGLRGTRAVQIEPVDVSPTHTAS